MELFLLTGLLYAGYNLSKKDEPQNYPLSRSKKNVPANTEFAYYLPQSGTSPNYNENNDSSHISVDKNGFDNPNILDPNTLANDFLLNSQDMYSFGNLDFAKKKEREYAHKNYKDAASLQINKSQHTPGFELDSYRPDFNYIHDIDEQDEKRMFMMQSSADWHNNMTPFYGSSVKQNTDLAANQPLLGRYTAHNDDVRQKREEVSSMFAPEPNTSTVFGDTSQIKNHEQNKSRFIPSVYQQNVLPTESVKIGPGLNLPTEVVARDGWQEMTRILPPTTNEMRTINKPKEEYKARTVLGKHYITNRELKPTVHKNRPEKFLENRAGERNFATTGAVLKAIEPVRYRLPENNRNAKIQVIGPAYNGAQLKLIHRDFHKQKSKRKSYENNYMGPIHTQVPSQANCNKSTYYAKNTFRQEYESQNPISNIISQISKAIMRPFDKTKNTKKQLYTHNTRHGEGPHASSKGTVQFADTARKTIKQEFAATEQQVLNSSAAVKASAVYNPGSRFKKTKKQTTLAQAEPLNMAAGNLGVVYDPASCAKITPKEEIVISQFDAANFASSTQGGIVYDVHNVPKVTVKQTTTGTAPLANLHSSTQGLRVLSGDAPRVTVKQTNLTEAPLANPANSVPSNPVFDPEDIFKTTMKETTIFENPGANFSSGQYMGQVFDTENAAKTTVKQTVTVDAPMANPHTNVSKNYVYDNTIQARTTVKEGVLADTPLANMAAGHSVTVFNPDNKMRTTIKQTTLQEAPVGNAHLSNPASTVYDPHVQAKTTVNETTLNQVPLSNLKSHNMHIVYNSEESPAKPTVKQTTLSEQQISNLQQSVPASAVYNTQEHAKKTIKETTIGEMAVSNLQQSVPMSTVYNTDNKAKLTTKQSTLTEQAVSNLSTTVVRAAVYNPENKAKPTIKEETAQEQPLTNAAAYVTAIKVYNPEDVAKHTVKETTHLEDYVGNVSAKDLQEGAYSVLKIKPRYTTRQDIEGSEQNQYFGAATNKINQTNELTNEFAYKNTTTNALKEIIAEGREPTLSGAKVSHSGSSFGRVVSNRYSEKSTQKYTEPTLLEEFQYFKMTQNSNAGLGNLTRLSSTTDQREFGIETKSKNMNEAESVIDTSLLNAFKNNPYTQPLDSAV